MLKSFFEENPQVAVAFSGGVDSAFLLHQAVKYARRAVAYCAETGFMLPSAKEEISRLAETMGAPLRFVPFAMCDDEAIAANTPLRCYLCKKGIMSAVAAHAAEDGLSLIIDGSNADDDPAQRPGMKALEELGVRSPLREAGLSKAEIRRLSREAGLPTWDMPSYSCAATRVPTGVRLSDGLLRKIAAGEEALKGLGFSRMRLRWRGGGVKLELPEEQLAMAFEKRNEILAALGGEFTEISLDLKGRKDNG